MKALSSCKSDTAILHRMAQCSWNCRPAGMLLPSSTSPESETITHTAPAVYARLHAVACMLTAAASLAGSVTAKALQRQRYVQDLQNKQHAVFKHRRSPQLISRLAVPSDSLSNPACI
jgi:hypothetical protein